MELTDPKILGSVVSSGSVSSFLNLIVQTATTGYVNKDPRSLLPVMTHRYRRAPPNTNPISKFVGLTQYEWQVVVSNDSGNSPVPLCFHGAPNCDLAKDPVDLWPEKGWARCVPRGNMASPCVFCRLGRAHHHFSRRS